MVARWTLLPVGAKSGGAGAFSGKVGSTIDSTLKLDCLSVACNTPAATIAVRCGNCEHITVVDADVAFTVIV